MRPLALVGSAEAPVRARSFRMHQFQAPRSRTSSFMVMAQNEDTGLGTNVPVESKQPNVTVPDEAGAALRSSKSAPVGSISRSFPSTNEYITSILRSDAANAQLERSNEIDSHVPSAVKVPELISSSPDDGPVAQARMAAATSPEKLKPIPHCAVGSSIQEPCRASCGDELPQPRAAKAMSTRACFMAADRRLHSMGKQAARPFSVSGGY